MKHRHLVAHSEWTNAKIDDILDRGRFEDWVALRDAVNADRSVALRVRNIASAAPRYGTSKLWLRYVATIYPVLTES